jgi:hypothetical protein
MTVVHGLRSGVGLGYPRRRDLERSTMTEHQVPPGPPGAWEIDDLTRMRRVHEYLEREYLQIPEGPYRREYGGSVPNVGADFPDPLAGRSCSG